MEYHEHTVDGCAILHHLMVGKHPIADSLSTIRLAVQDFTRIHGNYLCLCHSIMIYDV